MKKKALFGVGVIVVLAICLCVYLLSGAGSTYYYSQIDNSKIEQTESAGGVINFGGSMDYSYTLRCYDEDGNEKVLTLYREGFLFGEASFFDQMPRVSSAMALTRCRIIPIDRGMVAREIGNDPTLALHLLKYLARTVRLLSVHVDDMAFLPADRRIARHLLALQPQPDGTLRCTHEDIAASVGVSRVTVSRILTRFGAQGWLETGYRGIRICRRQALEQFLSQAGS